jgi:iron complex outermembrane recepter protein
MNRISLLAGVAASLFPVSAFAQPSNVASQPPAPETDRAAPGEPQDHVHGQSEDAIIITAPFVRQLDILAGTSTLSGDALARALQPQLGDTLARLPGVSATSFSPGASRPVLRGFQGERVRVLVDGIGSIDVSNTSADHAVTIDPITADRIEVLHGPAVLLFGGQAIGGAVNVFDRRIPRRVPDDRFFHIDAIAGYGSAAEERSIAAGLDVSLGGGLVFHVDGSYRRTDDLETGGFILSPQLRAEQLEIAAEEEEEGHTEEAAEARELAELRGRLPNSAVEQTTGGAGLALIRDWGSIGGSLSIYESRYGVPSRPGGGHHHEEEGEEGEEGHDHGAVPVSIDLEQVRGDIRADIALGGFFERLRFRFAAADYSHTEFEGDEVGTVFDTNGLEGRFELVQADRRGWRGAIGAQYFHRDFDAVGAEAFIRANTTSQLGLFTLQEIDLGNGAQLEGALRYEHTDVDSQFLGISRSFDAFSAAAGASFEIAPLVRVGLNLSRAERAPAAEELYSNGPHIATQAFEVGDPTFTTERSLGGELFIRAQTPNVQFSGTLFYTRFDNYIFAQDTGEEEDELPVFRYVQVDADYWGFEAGVSGDIAQFGSVRIGLDGTADFVKATIAPSAGGGPVPRIPPLRLRGGIGARNADFEARAEVEHVFEQERVAAFETPTADFTLVNASLTWHLFGADNPTSLSLTANNIFDVEARRHASFTKDFVPLAGRDLRATLRVSF